MIKWLSLPESTKRNAFIQIAEETGISAFAIEKDWWVSRTLEIIFQMDIAKHLVFKGGTSLSKNWESDYAKMIEEMIYEKNPPSFDRLIGNLFNLKDMLLNVGWKFELTFKP